MRGGPQQGHRRAGDGRGGQGGRRGGHRARQRAAEQRKMRSRYKVTQRGVCPSPVTAPATGLRAARPRCVPRAGTLWFWRRSPRLAGRMAGAPWLRSLRMSACMFGAAGAARSQAGSKHFKRGWPGHKPAVLCSPRAQQAGSQRSPWRMPTCAPMQPPWPPRPPPPLHPRGRGPPPSRPPPAPAQAHRQRPRLTGTPGYRSRHSSCQ